MSSVRFGPLSATATTHPTPASTASTAPHTASTDPTISTRVTGCPRERLRRFCRSRRLIEDCRPWRCRCVIALARPRSKAIQCTWVALSAWRLRLLFSGTRGATLGGGCHETCRNTGPIGAVGRLEIELGLAGGAGPREWSPGGPCGPPGWWSLLSGMFAVLSFGRAAGTDGFDPASLTAPFGYFGNLLAAPFARWDSVWYLAIAQGGYDHEATPDRVLPDLSAAAARGGAGDRLGSDRRRASSRWWRSGSR